MAKRPLAETLQRFTWFNEPANWEMDDVLEIQTLPDTDYWQRTHYGFRRDNGHFFFTTLAGDFTIRAHFVGFPLAQYDQCGLMVRVDAENWIKCSTETETPEFSRLGSVVTNLGYSDWATQDVPATQTEVWYAIERSGADFELSWSLDGQEWRQMRIPHLHGCPDEIQVGVYACSPKGEGFRCRVDALEVQGAGGYR